MATAAVWLGCLVVFVLLIIVIDDHGGVARHYSCKTCNKTGPGPATYIPAQTKAPICKKCGKPMTETDDV